MELGVRQIRTSGRGSGSVELTLPGALRGLVGVPCSILVHNGAQPHIVLQPALKHARQAFEAVWFGLTSVLLDAPLPTLDLDVLHPVLLAERQHLQNADSLYWQDGVALAAHAAAPRIIGRVVASLSAVIAIDLGIDASLAADFAAAAGYLICGVVAYPEWQQACDIAAAELGHLAAWSPGEVLANAGDPLTDKFWSRTAPGLTLCADFFVSSSQDGAAYPATRAAWRRGRSIELNRG